MLGVKTPLPPAKLSPTVPLVVKSHDIRGAARQARGGHDLVARLDHGRAGGGESLKVEGGNAAVAEVRVRLTVGREPGTTRSSASPPPLSG